MIPSEWVSGDYRCPKCDLSRTSTDINRYCVDGKDHTRIKLVCIKCKTYVGTVDIWEPAAVKAATNKIIKRRRRNMGVGSSLGVPDKE